MPSWLVSMVVNWLGDEEYRLVVLFHVMIVTRARPTMTYILFGQNYVRQPRRGPPRFGVILIVM